MMQVDERNSFKNELSKLIDGYIENCEVDMDMDTIKTVQKILRINADGLEDYIQDIDRTRLNMRSKLLAYLIGIFADNDNTIFGVKFNENPLGFDIEVDMSWDEDTANGIYEKVVEKNDPILSRAMAMFRISINPTNSIISFIPHSSS